MDNYLLNRNNCRKNRQMRVRKHVRGTAEKPRLSVFRTNLHISAQLIDDESKVTLMSAGTMNKDMRGGKHGKKSKEAAKIIGTKLAEFAKKNKIERAVFDRGRYKYHGVIAELANAAREAGLQI